MSDPAAKITKAQTYVNNVPRKRMKTSRCPRSVMAGMYIPAITDELVLGGSGGRAGDSLSAGATQFARGADRQLRCD